MRRVGMLRRGDGSEDSRGDGSEDSRGDARREGVMSNEKSGDDLIVTRRERRGEDR